MLHQLEPMYPGVRRRLHGKTSIAKAEVDESELLLQCTVCDDEDVELDEKEAAAFLEVGDFSMDALEKLLDGLRLKQCVASKPTCGGLW